MGRALGPGRWSVKLIFFFRAEDGIRDLYVTGVQTCALPIYILCLSSGEISQELKQRMFATMPGFEAIWPAIEKGGEEILKTAVLSKIVQESSVRERSEERRVGKECRSQ